MRRRVALSMAVVCVVGVVLAPPVAAALHEVSMGNYWFEDDETKSRGRLTVEQGDQIRFTVREPAYPPHSVQVDELGIDSPDLQVFDTYTTPPLNKPGTYRLYCRAHQDRGHETTLVVQARATTTTTRRTTASSAGAEESTTSTTLAPKEEAGPTTTFNFDQGFSPETTEALAPVGVGAATDRRRPPPDPDSLAGILGRQPREPGPWTRALWQALAAGVLLAALAALAWSRDLRRRRYE